MKVLIAEDDAHIRRGLKEVLEAEGYDVVEAANGRDALDLLDPEQPDFALLDIMMPEVNGYDVCRDYQRRRPEMPVIFISAKSEEIDRVLGLELGADDFIPKPFGVREVIARIRAVTRRAYASRGEQPGEEVLEIDGLVVYPRELRAKKGDAMIELSLRDVRILKLLHRERGRVVTREMLFNECWGMSYLPNSRTIDQHISKLRKRVEDDPKNPALIKTVHGVGYRID
ncbi:MAG: response regulator transcription factor [Deltaproteobacteria bacterium]|nr:MAG: response regulator transcription factor [Deltaproteobacteria bacterium]